MVLKVTLWLAKVETWEAVFDGCFCVCAFVFFFLPLLPVQLSRLFFFLFDSF